MIEENIRIKGKPGQTVYPNFVVSYTDKSGNRNIIYGDTASGEQHGHNVISPSGDVKFARTRGGNVLTDK